MHNLLKKRQQGFTLIELIIVMVIIAILVLLLLPNLSNGPKRARDSQRKSDFRSVQSALEQYFSDNNSYPPDGGGGTGGFTGLGTYLVPQYIKTLPTDPKNGGTNGTTGYQYQYAATPGSCAAGACTGYTMTVGLAYTNDPKYPTYTVNNAQ